MKLFNIARGARNIASHAGLIPSVNSRSSNEETINETEALKSNLA